MGLEPTMEILAPKASGIAANLHSEIEKHLNGIEPSSQPWQGRVFAITPQVHILLGISDLNRDLRLIRAGS